MTYYTADEAASAAATLTPMAARILVFLFLQAPGHSFTGRQLAAKFGSSTNTISAAMRNLEANGFVQYNGKNNGWSLPISHQLPLVDNPVDNLPPNRRMIQEFLDDPKKFGSSPSYDDVNTLNDPDNHHHSFRSQNDPKFFGSSPDHSGEQERKRLLRQYGVRGKAIMRYSTPPCPETAVILAICWESLTQPLGNPGGWIHSQLRSGYEPGEEFHELANFWLNLDQDDRHELAEIVGEVTLPHYKISDLVNEFNLSYRAAELAINLRPLGAFNEA